MGEIVRNAVGVGVEFTIPAASATVTSAKVKRGAEVYDAVIAVVTGTTVVQIPYEITRYDGDFTVEYIYTVGGKTYTTSESHKVVTPLFTKDTLVEFDPDFSVNTPEEVAFMDRTIRSIFKTITGQEFGLSSGYVTVTGNGGTSLSLPKRSVNPNGPVYENSNAPWYGVAEGPYALVTEDGWVVSGFSTDSWIDVFEPRGPKRFNSGQRYTFSGEWGYYSPPEDIVLAAMTLASDYGCDQAVWRDRYLKSARMGDIRVEYNGQAYLKTGNVKVDQILDRYARVRMVIL